MRGVAFFLPVLFVTPTAASTQTPYPAPRPVYASQTAGYSVGYALNDWRLAFDSLADRKVIGKTIVRPDL